MISTLLLVRDCVTEGKIHSSVLCFKMIERKSLLEIELAMQLTRYFLPLLPRSLSPNNLHILPSKEENWSSGRVNEG